MKANIKVIVLFLSLLSPFYVFSDDNCQEIKTTINCLENDYIALRALYLSTNGDNWDNNTDWPTAAQFAANPTRPAGTDVKTWHGINTNETGCVVWLSLTSDNLTGTIPPELGSLSDLEALSLRFNNLSGPIPPELGNLTNLTFLALDDNNLDGSIPPELGNLTNATHLNLNDNNLSGNIPPELGNLASLRFLSLYNNGLSGTIPPELGGLASLEGLLLNNNDLTGTIIPEIMNLLNLKYIHLHANAMTGTIPSAIVNLTNLIELKLSGNQLTGNILPELGNLTDLRYLELASNQFTGSIPPELGNLTILYWLTLHNNNLTGTIPPELGNLSYLNWLLLNDNNLTGNIPPELGGLVNVRYMRLSENNLTGGIPTEFGNLIDLEWLYLNDNQLSGCYPASLLTLCGQIVTSSNADISSGNTFSASWEDFCATGASTCTCQEVAYTALRALYLSTDGDNWTDNTGWPTAAEFMTNPTMPPGTDVSTWYGVVTDASGCVAELDLSNNNLVGNITGQLGHLTNLQHLDLSNNQLSGCYDPFLYATLCNQLISANFDGNNLDASWQDVCGTGVGMCLSCSERDYFALRALYLSTDGDNWTDNTGWPTAAEFMANLTMPLGMDVDTWYGVTTDSEGCVWCINMSGVSSCTDFGVSGNGLTGSIPPEIGNLTNLIWFNLHNNNLSGSIPREIGNLNNLLFLGLSSNQLSGCYDENLAVLCSQLNPFYNTNNHISDGNNFDATWEDFCATSAGACSSDCSSDIIVNDIPIPNSLYQAQQTITSSGHVVSGNHVVFQAGELIVLDTSFTVHPGGSLDIEIEDCQ